MKGQTTSLDYSCLLRRSLVNRRRDVFQLFDKQSLKNTHCQHHGRSTVQYDMISITSGFGSARNELATIVHHTTMNSS